MAPSNWVVLLRFTLDWICGYALDRGAAYESSASPSRSAGALTACVGTPLSSRLAIPTSVPAGGNSTIAVTFDCRRVSVHRSQRTGRVNWATSLVMASPAEATG